MITPGAVVAAASMLSRRGLVTAFGHVSVRLAADRLAITPAVPLGTIDASTEMIELDVDTAVLPADAPAETWMHLGIYRARADVTAIARAQPPSAHPASALPGPLLPVHGQGAWLGRSLAVHDDARLVRTEDAGAAVAGVLAGGRAALLRGNGAVAVGTDVREAATAQWVVEQTCAHLLRVAGRAHRELDDTEVAAWSSTWPELWPRLWAYLDSSTADAGGTADPDGGIR